jgi:rubrerythrin
MAAFDAAQALEMAQQIEKNGEAYYTAVAGKQADPEVKRLFEDLAAQERIHYQIFSQMLATVGPAPVLPAEEYDQYDAYLKVALDSALFAGPDKALALAAAAKDKTTAVRGALGFEKDTLLFFYDLREMVAEKDRAAVTRIVSEEKSHVRRLARMLA